MSATITNMPLRIIGVTAAIALSLFVPSSHDEVGGQTLPFLHLTHVWKMAVAEMRCM